MVAEAPETISDELNIATEAEETAEESPARRRGRPEGAKNKGPDPTFFDRLKDLDWERNVVYIYRTEPLVDLTTGGGPKYATKYAEPFDEDKVMRDLGSGKYQARVSQTQPTTGKGKQTDVYTFEIFNTQFPPQIPVGAWLDDHRNARWKWAKELLAAQPPQANGNPPPAPDVAKQVTAVLQEIRQGQVSPTDQFNAMVKAHQSGVAQGAEMAKPGGSGGEVVELLKTLLPAILKPPPQDNSVVQVLTLQLTAEREQRKADREQAIADRAAADKRADAAETRHNELMKAMLEKKENSGTDVIEQFGKMFGMFNQIREGGLGASDESWGGMFKDGIRDAMPDLVRTLAPGVAGMLSGIGTGARPALPPPQHQNVSRETVSPGVPPVSRETVPPGQQPPTVDPQFAPAYTVIFMNQGALLNCVRSGKTGLDFGDFLAHPAGPGEIEIEKLKTAGVDNIIRFISIQLPQLWAELQPVELKFRGFLQDLMTWTPDEGEDDPEPEVGTKMNGERVIRGTGEPAPALVMPGTAKQNAKDKKKNAGGKVQ